MPYLKLKTVIHEILSAQSGVGQIMNGWNIFDNDEAFRQEGSYVVLVDGIETNLPNAENRWSLLRSQLSIHAIKTDPADGTTTDQLREIINEQAMKIRRLMKNNPFLISTSAPSGFATHSILMEVEKGKLVLPDGIARQSAWIKLEASHMKDETS